jgi:DNA-binding XRE family transcriptional regulator
MSEQYNASKSIEPYIALLKKGDAPSLKQLRSLLGKTQAELAQTMGVPEDTLRLWEAGEQQPLGTQRAKWKIKLASYIDEKIAAVLKTEDNEISHRF